MSDAHVNDPGTAVDWSHQVIPEDATIILPVRNVLLFPGIVLALTIGRPSSIAAAQEAVRSGRKVGLLQDDPNVEQPGPDNLRRVGTVAEIMRYVTSEATHYIICRGLRRFVSRNSSPAFRTSLVAIQAGIATVMLPARNRKDLEDVPKKASNRIRFVWLDRVDDAMARTSHATPTEGQAARSM
jgi:ATP-dependent Lon protease